MTDQIPETTEGKLYIVATPIGNLEDITLRALRILKTVGLIAAEDTRRTRTLLRAYEITTPVTSLHDHSEAKKSGALIARLKEGQDIAYVSDAGTPGISDPGYVLIHEAIDQDIAVIPIPGPSAVVTALCASGLPMHAFMFFSFLPAKTAHRREILRSLAAERRTLIFYESPNRLQASLKDIRDILGNRRIVIARELTKLYEEIIRGDLDKVLEALKDRTVKGEITLVIAGGGEEVPTHSDDDIRKRLRELKHDATISLRGRIDQTAHEMGLSRRRVYQIALERDFS